MLARQRRSTTESDQVVTEPAVLPAESNSSPDLAGYAKLASNPLSYRTHFPLDARP